jgi:preprotein translocase subunit SecG
MGIVGIFLLVIFVITCLLLVFMVIIQDSDSDSLGGIFAGGSGSAFGSRSSNVVVRFTYVLGALFFVTAFGLAIVNKSSVGNVEKAAQKATKNAQTEWWNPSAPAVPAPEGLQPSGAGGTEAAAPTAPAPTPTGGNK